VTWMSTSKSAPRNSTDPTFPDYTLTEFCGPQCARQVLDSAQYLIRVEHTSKTHHLTNHLKAECSALFLFSKSELRSPSK
jgi:hypothetical protein